MTPTRVFLLHTNLNPSILNRDVVTFNRRALCGKTLAAADVEEPPVQIAFDDVAVQTRIGERITFVRAEIFDGAKLTVDIEQSDFRAAREFYSGAASRRDRLGLPDGNRFSFALRLSLVSVMLAHIKFRF